MRLRYQEQPRLDCPEVSRIELNVKCRDEIIPILRALQHVYEDKPLLGQLLTVVGKDVNDGCSRKHGRQGLDYWSITVLAAVRLGCNFDYDKLQDLAEQHRNLRLIMGIGDWQEHVDFDWRRIRDNVCLLRPETLKKINQAVVAAGHELEPKAAEAVRGDTFVVETNIHHPTESTLLGDGLRKVVKLAAALAAEHGLPGWRQQEHWLKNIRNQVQKIGRAARAKGQGSERLQPGYQELLGVTKELLERARQLVAGLSFRIEPAADGLRAAAQMREVLHYVTLTEKVCDN